MDFVIGFKKLNSGSILLKIVSMAIYDLALDTNPSIFNVDGQMQDIFPFKGIAGFDEDSPQAYIDRLSASRLHGAAPVIFTIIGDEIADLDPRMFSSFDECQT